MKLRKVDSGDGSLLLMDDKRLRNPTIYISPDGDQIIINRTIYIEKPSDEVLGFFKKSFQFYSDLSDYENSEIPKNIHVR